MFGTEQKILYRAITSGHIKFRLVSVGVMRNLEVSTKLPVGEVSHLLEWIDLNEPGPSIISLKLGI